jgi:2-phospho-L-lactate guanylyltransferase
MSGGVWAVVPAKDLGEAKRRLTGVLSLEERQELVRAMLSDVLTALTTTRGLAGTIVVTRDAELAALARRFGAQILSDLRHEGPSAAIALAARHLAAEGAAGMVAIPSDVPLVTAAEIDEILITSGPAPAVTLVPALADMGTNAIALAPADAIPLRFGPSSFFRHQEAALDRGIAPRVLRLPGLGLDVDRAHDLAAFAREASLTASFACLEAHGILGRLSDPDIGRDLHAHNR